MGKLGRIKAFLKRIIWGVGRMAAKADVPVVDNNRHVKEYLAHYISFRHAPRYAVLLDGPWGIGKTFLVQKFLKEHFAGENDYVYVSLYGLTSTDEIDAALFRAMYPVLEWKGTKLAGRAAKTVLKSFRLDPDIKLSEVLSKAATKLHVFDDLERCELPINKVMGYINEFVEHEGCKVLIVANEEEILDRDEYRRRREKLIGKTLAVQSAFDEALTYFTSQVDDALTKSLFEAKPAEISALYHQSGLNNLRILQQTMWDFERLFPVLSDKHRKSDKAVISLLRLFFSLSFELKAGRIQPKDLMSRIDGIVAGMMARHNKADPTRLSEANSRYPEIELHDDILSDELLSDILVKGIIDEDEIRAFLNRNPDFAAEAEEPAWRVVWNAMLQTDAEFTEAFKKMEEQFAAREFEATGEILHVFGLRLWLAEIGVLERSFADVVADAKQYVDDIYTQRRLEPLMPNAGTDAIDVRFASYGGLGMYMKDTKDFSELIQYLEAKRNKAREDYYPAQAVDLLKEMETDPGLYFRRLNVTNSDENIYCEAPVLASIDPDTFVTTLLKLHPKDQVTVFKAFKSRYDYGRLDRALAAERLWLEAVREKLLAAANTMPPMGKYRVIKSIEQTIDPALEDEE